MAMLLSDWTSPPEGFVTTQSLVLADVEYCVGLITTVPVTGLTDALGPFGTVGEIVVWKSTAPTKSFTLATVIVEVKDEPVPVIPRLPALGLADILKLFDNLKP